MNRQRGILRGTSGLAAALLLMGCAAGQGSDTFGSRLQTEGGAMAKLGEQWTGGERDVAKGRALIEDGQDDVEDGQALIDKGRKKIQRGERLIRDGERSMRDAESAFRARNSGANAPAS